MATRMPHDTLWKLLEKVVLFILSFFVVVLLIAAIWELRPFYGYGLENTAVQVIGQTVSGINSALFQHSLLAYIWYVFALIVVAVALCSVTLVASYLILLKNLRLKKKQAMSRFLSYLERSSLLNIAQGLRKHLDWAIKGLSGRLRKKRAGEIANAVPTKGREWRTYAWQISLLFFVALIVFTYRYAVLPVPQGWDTPSYIYSIMDLKQNPADLLQYWNRPLSIAVMYGMTSLFGLRPEVTMMILTPLIGIVYGSGVYLLVVTGTKKKSIALLAGLYTMLTFSTIRLSMDLYSNYLAWALAMYALSYYVKTVEPTETKTRYTVTAAAILVLVALSLIWALAFLTVIVVAYILLEVLTGGPYRKIIRRTLIVYTPVAVLGISIVAIARPKQIQEVLSFIGLFSTSDQWAFASRENPYIIALAIIGIIAIMTQKISTYSKIIISWTIVTSAAMLTGIFDLPDRIFCLMPVAILGAHGTQAILDRTTQHPNLKSIRKPVVPLIFLLTFTAMIPHAYLPDYSFTPSNEAMQQLYWIQQHYGYENHSLVVCFDVSPPAASGFFYSSHIYWGLAILGKIVYDGPLLYLIQGIADSQGTSFQNTTGKTIIIPNRFYQMTPLEYKASQKISDLGIYEVKFKTLPQIDQIIRNVSMWQEDDFEKDKWAPDPPWIASDYNYSVTNESSTMNISLTPLHSDRWFDVETRLPATINSTSHLIIKAKGDIDSLTFEVNLYSDKGMLAWAVFSKYITPKNYTYLQMDLTPDMPISFVRLSFYSANVTGIESYLQVDYIALI